MSHKDDRVILTRGKPFFAVSINSNLLSRTASTLGEAFKGHSTPKACTIQDSSDFLANINNNPIISCCNDLTDSSFISIIVISPY